MIGTSDLGGYWFYWVPYLVLLGLGVVLAQRSIRAYRQRPTYPLGLMGAGVMLLTVGYPASWSAMFLGGADMVWCSFVSSVVAVAGGAILLLAIVVRTE